MKKHFTDETTGISYTLQGDYYLPDLELPTEEITHRRKRIKHRRLGYATRKLPKAKP